MRLSISIICKVGISLFMWLCLQSPAQAQNNWASKKLHICDGDSVYVVTVAEPGLSTKLKLKFGLLSVTDQEILPTIYDYITFFKKDMLELRLDNKIGICNTKGDIIIPVECSDIGYLEDEYYKIKKDNKVGIFNINTQKFVVPIAYSSLLHNDISIGAIPATKNWTKPKRKYLTVVLYNDGGVSQFDLINQKTLIPFGEYENIGCSDSNGLVRVTKDSKWTIMDYQGKKYLSSDEYDDAEIMPYGFITIDNVSRKKGFVSLNGSTIEPMFDNIEFGDNGIGIVWQNRDLDSYDYAHNKRGAINSEGKQIVPIKYDRVEMNGKCLYVWMKDKAGIIDFDGNIIFPPNKYDEIEYYPEYKVGVVTKGDYEGLVNIKNKTLVPVIYDNVYFADGIARFDKRQGDTNRSKSGMYNLKTKKMVKPLYDGIEKFVNGVAVVGYFSAEGNKYGLIDENGKELVKPSYNTMFFDEKQQYATVSNADDRKHGMIGARGEVVVPVIFDKFMEYRTERDAYGIAIGKKGDKYGAFNFHDKKELLPPTYDEIISFDGRGLRYKVNETYGFIDLKGKTLLAPQYGFIGIMPHGHLKVKNNTKFGIVDFEEKVVVPYEYDYIDGIFANGPYISYLLAKKGDKVGVIDYSNKIVFDFDFDSIKFSYKSSCCIATKGNQKGVLDFNKKEFITSGESIEKILKENDL